ncbi:MAG: DUF4175 family protein [Hyphomicrobiales bacterium]|nr:DUF4175 family protein [Hyphomicrobiales bacterium]
MKQKPSYLPGPLKWSSKWSLRFALLRAGWVVFLERVRAGLWMPVSLLLLFIAAAVSGVFELLPTYLHVVLLSVFLIAFLASVFFADGGLARFRFPGVNARARRLEEENALAHRPLREAGDVPIVNTDNGLWRAHKAWQASQLSRALRSGALRTGTVRAGPAARDTYALRVGALVLAIAALGVSTEPIERFWRALSPFAFDEAASRANIEIWVAPPAYTGRAPLYPAVPAEGGEAVTMEVPEGSELVIHIEDGGEAFLRAMHNEHDEDAEATATEEEALADGRAADGRATDGKAASGKPAGGKPADGRAAYGKPAADKPVAGKRTPVTLESLNFEVLETLPTGALEYRAVLDDESEYELLAAGMREPVRWNFTILRDRPPSIALVSPVGFTQLGNIRIEYTTQDDYAVTSAHARIELDPGFPPNQEIARLEGRPPSAPPASISLPLSPSREGEAARAYHDLTAHPWAGLPVRLTLVAQDEAGQTATSRQDHFVLPEIGFETLLARSFMELRRNLTLRPDRIEWVGRALDAFAIGPEKYELDASDYLHLRSAYWKLRYGKGSPESIEEVRALLWHMALRAESGNLPDLEEQLRQAREALERAIAEKAPQGEIRERLEEFRKILEQYLSQQARNNIDKGEVTREHVLETIDADQISEMLQKISDLSAIGSYEEAQQLLSELEDILQNLEFSAPSRPTPQEQATREALRELRSLEREQQRLLDQTFQEQLRACPIGEVCGDSAEIPSDTARELQELQEQLRSRLDELLENLAQEGVAPPESLQQGRGSMEEAAEGLGRGESGEGLRAQADALERLQEARDELRQRGGGGRSAGREGRGGRRGGSGTDHDPLGRSASGDSINTDDDIVPESFDPQRARELRGELLRRMGESWRPRDELNYFERLLRSSIPAITP